MKPKILLVNPPIYDFTAYDFWLRPLGLLEAAGPLRGKAEFVLFDYLDNDKTKIDRWGRGKFPEQIIETPQPLKIIPRRFRRYGLPRESFRKVLQNYKFDYAFLQTAMTYWYPGLIEVIEDIRSLQPQTKIILGGTYATLCPAHAKTLSPDLIVTGTDLNPLWNFLGLEPDTNQPALWEGYEKLNTAALKLTDGCPFNCTYCSVPKVYKGFAPRPLETALAELELITKLGASNIAFYDDALLYKSEQVLIPFLNEIIKRGIKINLHTPNALNARFISRDLAKIMLRAGFKTFYIGLESSNESWQNQTGSKVYRDEFASAVENLKSAGASSDCITAYQILGHPKFDSQCLEESMRFVASLGVSGMLADFSPIPGTPDGGLCSQWGDMSEPLMHNKTAFAAIRLGFDQTNRLKNLQRQLNHTVNS
jgi:radical SAM superfamily enzyme YgiQ (UPF0313 family)